MAELYSDSSYSVENRITCVKFLLLTDLNVNSTKIVTTACEREMEAVKRIMTCHLACC